MSDLRRGHGLAIGGTALVLAGGLLSASPERVDLAPANGPPLIGEMVVAAPLLLATSHLRP